MAKVDPMTTENAGLVPKAETVTVKALQLHTCHGQEYAVGDEYEIEAGLVDSIIAQGKAARVDTLRLQNKAVDTTPTKGKK